MYSESDLEAAVAAGVLTPGPGRALPGFRRRPAGIRRPVDEEHFRLLTGFNDIFVGIAALILLVAVGLDRPLSRPDRRSTAPRLSRPVRRRHRLGPRRILHAEAAHGAAKHHPLLAFLAGIFALRVFADRAAVGERNLESPGRLSRARGQRGDRRRRRLAALAALHGADHRRGRRRRGGRPGHRARRLGADRQRRPADRRRRATRIISLLEGTALLLGIGTFPSRCGGTRPTGARDAALGRRLLAAPAGGAADRPSGLLAARPHRGPGLDARRVHRRPALRRARPGRAGDRPARLAGLGARLRALRDQQPVPRPMARSS
jgi:hypothetical protein